VAFYLAVLAGVGGFFADGLLLGIASAVAILALLTVVFRVNIGTWWGW
jgi:hypothetical protein